jgi:hypothetical protein
MIGGLPGYILIIRSKTLFFILCSLLIIRGGFFMNDEDRRLFTESIAEMRGLKGELKEFKLHILDRIKRLEINEGKRGQSTLATISVIIAAGALLIGFIANFCR